MVALVVRAMAMSMALAVLAGGCAEDEPPVALPGLPGDLPADAGLAPPEDADGLGQTPAGPVEVEGPAAALAGVWHGQKDTESHGPVIAELEVTPGGVVVYTVVAQGHVLVGDLFVERWDGRRLRVRTDTGTHELPARREGDALVLDLPVVGTVRLARQGGAR